MRFTRWFYTYRQDCARYSAAGKSSSISMKNSAITLSDKSKSTSSKIWLTRSIQDRRNRATFCLTTRSSPTYRRAPRIIASMKE